MLACFGRSGFLKASERAGLVSMKRLVALVA